MSDPASVVRAFMADYKAWNDTSFAEFEKAPEADHAQAETAYGKLLKKYCRPGFEGEPIAFGSSSSHDPEHELIESVSTSGPTSIVTTKYTEDMGSYSTTTVNEYHLTLEGGRWYLEEVYLVDAQGKYKGL